MASRCTQTSQSTPNLDEATLKRCRPPVDSPFDGLFTFVVGSDSTCAARVDASAPQAGIMPGAAQPFMTRLDFVENSNDSHWLVTPAARLEGFASIVGGDSTWQFSNAPGDDPGGGSAPAIGADGQ